MVDSCALLLKESEKKHACIYQHGELKWPCLTTSKLLHCEAKVNFALEGSSCRSRIAELILAIPSVYHIYICIIKFIIYIYNIYIILYTLYYIILFLTLTCGFFVFSSVSAPRPPPPPPPSRPPSLPPSLTHSSSSPLCEWSIWLHNKCHLSRVLIFLLSPIRDCPFQIFPFVSVCSPPSDLRSTELHPEQSLSLPPRGGKSHQGCRRSL